MPDTDKLRDEVARLKGWTYTESVEGWYRGGWKEEHRCKDHHPYPNTLDAAIAVIEGGGWEWERHGCKIIMWRTYTYQWLATVISIAETGDRLYDFWSAALAKVRATTKEADHAE